jgi:uncharacterized membrane protein YkoI
LPQQTTRIRRKDVKKRTKLVAATLAGLSVIGVGAGVSVAAGGDDDKRLTGTDYDRAAAAAIEYVGGGTVVETEVGDDGAAYGVEVRLDDGSQVEVLLDENFTVTGAEPDDDGANDSEEAND